MEVIFYSNHCPKCRVLQMKLEQKQINYSENNDIDYMLNVLKLKSVPALSVNGKILSFSDAIRWVNQQKVDE